MCAHQKLVQNLAILLLLGTLLCHCGTPNGAESSTKSGDVKKEREPETYPRRLLLGKNGEYTVEWRYTDDDVVFRVSVETSGWVGLGFSPRGGMEGADVVIGWVDNGKAFLTDRFAVGNQQPALDTKQDYQLLSGVEEDNKTILVFQRKLNTSDCEDVVLNSETIRLIWSYSDKDPDVDNGGPTYHGPDHRGTKSIILLDSDHSKTQVPADAKKYEFCNNNVRPERQQQTLYWCTLFQFPKLQKRHHIIRFEPAVEPSSVGHIHHMLLFGCYSPLQDESLYSFSDICLKLPKDIQNCFSVMFSWAVGGEAFDFPDHVGYSIGGKGDPLFLRLEVHYDNPRLPADFKDSSGFRFYYTPNLRQHNGGAFPVGMFPMWWHIIPPRQEKFKSRGWCLKECTQLYFPSDGINMFSTFAHTHASGQAVRFRHFRNGTHLENFINDVHFDCDFQAIRHLKTEKTIMPGDTLHTECTFNTADRENVTYGGYGRTDEMCFSIVYYYPKIDNFGDCFSVAQPLAMLQRLGYNTSDLPLEMDQATTVNAFETFNWKDPNFISEYTQALNDVSLYFRCDNQTRLEQLDPFADWKVPQYDYSDDEDTTC
ncbi:DBH-like monooxygenase protein 1 [Asterias amurensis]|uniref:DBH-like monooxygenase protein 1 n=1 Tax=Asterias amurensis TaxID=7602 RepID=UPI003AB39274